MEDAKLRFNAHWDREEEPNPAVLANVVIQLGVSQNLSFKPREGQEHHYRKALQAHLDLLPHLVLQKPRVLHHLMVEDEIIRERRKREIQQMHAHQRGEDEG